MRQFEIRNFSIPKTHILAAALLLIAMTGLFHFLPALVGQSHSIRNARFEVLWKYATDKQILANPVIAGDVLIYGTYDGSLKGISTKNGRELWAQKFPDPIFMISADSRGTVYAGTGLHDNTTGLLTVVKAKTGEILWQRQFEGHLEASPRIDEEKNRLWISAGPGGLWSLDTRNGAVLWHKALGHIDATPLLHKEVVYVPAQKSETRMESTFFALDAGTGEIIWTLDQPGQPWAAPMLHKSDKMILTTTGIGQIGVQRKTDQGWAHAVSWDGKPVWTTQLPNTNMNPDTYIPESDQLIYVIKDGSLVSLKATDGSKLWNAKLGASFSSPGTVIKQFEERILAVMSEDGIFSLVKTDSGKVVFRYATGQRSQTAPVERDGVIYITTNFSITAIGAAQ